MAQVNIHIYIHSLEVDLCLERISKRRPDTGAVYRACHLQAGAVAGGSALAAHAAQGFDTRLLPLGGTLPGRRCNSTTRPGAPAQLDGEVTCLMQASRVRVEGGLYTVSAVTTRSKLPAPLPATSSSPSCDQSPPK